ncbi:MAG: hypothetical protein IKZ87_04205 [Actinomycetaceae bacterium]|nr:hypothetical protein [Actinomycetaceae bacterium]
MATHKNNQAAQTKELRLKLFLAKAVGGILATLAIDVMPSGCLLRGHARAHSA